MPIGVPFDGPVPGTEYIRISSEFGNGTHYYSTTQTWNADMTKVMVGNGIVDKNRLLDATNNFALLPVRINLNSDRIWSNVDPDIIYGLSGNALYKFNASTGQRQMIYSRPNGAAISLRGKAAIPDDDSKLLLYVPSENKLVSINLASTQVPRPVLGELNWTPYGNLRSGGMFLNFEHTGKYATVRTPDTRKTYRLSANLTNVVELPATPCCHSDSGYNTSGQSIQAETIWNGRLRIWNFDNQGIYNTASTINRTPGQSDYWFASYVSGRGQSDCGKSWIVSSCA